MLQIPIFAFKFPKFFIYLFYYVNAVYVQITRNAIYVARIQNLFRREFKVGFSLCSCKKLVDITRYYEMHSMPEKHRQSVLADDKTSCMICTCTCIHTDPMTVTLSGL